MISNASPLIVAAKVTLLKDIIEFYKTVEISPQVHYEIITRGLQAQKPDAMLLSALCKEGKIKVINLDKMQVKIARKIVDNYNIDRGEAETIALALQLHKQKVLMDEAIGRKVAKLFSLQPQGLLRVLIELYLHNKIDENTVKAKVNNILGMQFRLDADVLSKFWELFENVKIKK